MLNEGSIAKFFDWFGLQDDEVMQLNAYDLTREKKQYAITRYVRAADEVIGFCWQYEDMTLMAGLNPRPIEFLNKTKDAREEDISRIRHILFDIEPIHGKDEIVDRSILKQVYRFVQNKLKPYIGPSKLCFSGNGFHLLVDIPKIDPAKHTQFKQKAEKFRLKMLKDLKSDIERYKLRIDPTFDHIRRVKIYGTKKQIPDSRLSMWLEGTDKVLNMPLTKKILSIKIDGKADPKTVDTISITTDNIEKAYSFLKRCPAYYQILKEATSKQWQDREFLVKFLKYFMKLGKVDIKQLVARHNAWGNFDPKITGQKIDAHFTDGTYATKVKKYVLKPTLIKFGLCPDNCKKCIYELERYNWNSKANIAHA